MPRSGGHVDGLWLQLLPAREGQELTGQPAPAWAAWLHAFDEPLSARRVGLPLLSISNPPEITMRRLLKSCATPPVSWPMASIFCAWRSTSSTRGAFLHLGAQLVVRHFQLARALSDEILQLLSGSLTGPQQRAHLVLTFARAYGRLDRARERDRLQWPLEKRDVAQRRDQLWRQAMTAGCS
jgi:hypothetical protein